jgi:hypothetical protein
MQIISLILDHYFFYSPSTGAEILNESDVNENEPSLLGYWIDMCWNEPFIKNEYLENEWQVYLSTYKQLRSEESLEKEYRSLEDFFNSVNLYNVVVFKIAHNTRNSLTAYLVVDINYREP